MRKQIVVSLQDLRFVTLLCQACGTRVTIDFELELQRPCAPFLSPRDCPRCQRAFHAAVPEAVDAMQKVYKALAPLKNTVTFTGPEDSNWTPEQPA